MSEGWPLVRIGDIAEFVKRGKAPHYSEQGIVVLNQKCVRPGNILDLAPARRTDSDLRPVPDWALLRVGDTLINSTGRGTLGRACHVARLPEPATVDSHVTIVRPAAGKVEPGFLGLVCSTLSAHFANLESGSTNQTELSRTAIAGTPIPLPPLAVQRRIVDLMEHLDNQVNWLQAEANRLSDMYAAALKDTLPSNGDIPLADVLSTVRAGGTPSRKRPEFYGGTIPWLKSGEVNNDHIKATGERITDAALAGSSAWLVPEGSVILAMYGQGDTKGTAGYLDVPMCTNQAVLALVPDSSHCDGRFLLHWMRTYTDRLRAAASGAAQPNLSKEVVLRVTGFPALSLAEQGRLAATLDAMRDVWLRVSQERESLQGLRVQLLASLLRGETTIPRRNDELLGVAS